MTYEEMIKKAQSYRLRKKPTNKEHRLQCACVEWFEYAHKKYSTLMYAVPNGGRRDAVTGALLKAEGVKAGVSDLNFDLPNRFYHGLRIEIKTSIGRQSKVQKAYQLAVEAVGYKYVVCRSLDEFMKIITDYLNDV